MQRTNTGAMIVIGALVMASVGCDDGIGGKSSAELRILHLSPDAPPVSAFVDGETLDGSGTISFGQSTDYYRLTPGSHEIDVGATGSADTAQLQLGAVDFDAGRYTAVAIDRVADIRGILFSDDSDGLDADSIRVRAIHAAPDVGQVDILNIADDGTPLELTKNLDFGDVSDAIDVPAGAYTIGVDLDNDQKSELYFELPALDGGTLANVFVTEDADGGVLAYAQLERDTTAEILPARSELRVFHGSRDAPSIDVSANGELVVSDLAFASSSDTIDVASGTYDLAAFVAGTSTKVIDEAGVTLLPGTAYTLVAYGDVASLEAELITDDSRDIEDGKVRLQIFHAAPGIEMGDVYSLNEDGGAVDDLVPDLGFGGYGSTPDLAKAKYDVGFEANSSGLIIAEFEIPSLTVDSANVFIIQDADDEVYLVAQLVGAATALICESSVTGDCTL